ncbi:hypothetical protein K883_05154 [Mycobacterium sp. TKK-01-0059]|nr:hypothetical protein K883_05154 [Mycobacterium sp. TKK-01-0059]
MLDTQSTSLSQMIWRAVPQNGQGALNLCSRRRCGQLGTALVSIAEPRLQVPVCLGWSAASPLIPGHPSVLRTHKR